MRLWGIRVLVFDDDEEQLARVTDVLREEGGAAIHVASPHQALATIVGVTPDVMLVAVDRPALDPGRLMSLVRTLSPEKGGRTPAVSISALPVIEDDWRGRCPRVAFQGHLVRPVTREAFIATMGPLAGQWVERRHSQLDKPEWPGQVRRDRRREVRPPTPTDGDYLAAVSEALRKGPPRGPRGAKQ